MGSVWVPVLKGTVALDFDADFLYLVAVEVDGPDRAGGGYDVH